MKRNLLFLFMPLLLISCTSSNVENNQRADEKRADEKSIENYQGTKLSLCNEVNGSNLSSINRKAIEQGIYKPMYRLNAYSVSRIVYPFDATKLTTKAIDYNNMIVLNERITAEDKEDLVNQKFTTKEEANMYLKTKGYTLKTNVVLPINRVDKNSFYNSICFNYLLQRKLFVQKADGSFDNDLAVSFEEASLETKSGFLLTIKNDIYWKDIEGNNVEKVTSDDIIRCDCFQNKNDIITEVIKKDDNKVFFAINNEKSIELVKQEIINRFNTPRSKNYNLYNRDDCSITELENGYRVIINEIVIDNLIDDGTTDYDYLAATNDIDKIYHLRDNLFQTDYTYGFILNSAAGNEAYKKALNNKYFRNALLAILDHSKVKELTHYISLFNGAYDGADYRYITTNQTNPNLDAIAINEGVEEAKAQYTLAKENGITSDNIEIYTIDETNIVHKEAKIKYLEDAFNEVFGNDVKIVLKESPVYSYSTYNYYDNNYLKNSKNDFYREIELDGFYFVEESDYIKEALAQ